MKQDNMRIKGLAIPAKTTPLMLYVHMCLIYKLRDQDVKQTSGQFRSLNPMDLQLLRLKAKLL